MNAVIQTPPSEIEFREARRKYIGGSDIGAILGISPWKTPLQLWADKTTAPVLKPRESNLGAKQRGKRWESVVAEMLVEQLESDGHKVEIIASNQRYRDASVEHFAAEIDFEVKLDGSDEITNVELKALHPFRMKEWGDSGSDECPTHYTAQVMWGLGVTGRRNGILAPLFGADEIRTFPIAADDETISWMREKALAFWNDHVIANVAPAPINTSDCDRIYKAGFGPALVADEELTRLVLRLRAIKAESEAREREWDCIEFDIKRAMQDATELVVGGKTAISWANRPSTFLDQGALKETLPKVHREFTRTRSSRVFSLK